MSNFFHSPVVLKPINTPQAFFLLLQSNIEQSYQASEVRPRANS